MEQRGTATKDKEEARHTPGPTSRALFSHLIQFEIEENYFELLRSNVLSKVDPGRDRKRHLYFERVLKTPDARMVLAIIWKESPYVTAADLSAAGLSKTYDTSELTSHGLAVHLATTPRDVSKLNSKVRTIGLAAEHFGLITKRKLGSTRTVLEGTALLHDLMKALGESNISTIRRLTATIEALPN